jgi:hypothetical protein
MSEHNAQHAAAAAATRWTSQTRGESGATSHRVDEYFGCNVFDRKKMRSRLPKTIFRTLMKTIEEGARLDPDVADAVATAMKDWATENGATHYTHWFQPLTGSTAEKHDSMVVPAGEDGVHLRLQRRRPRPGRARRFELSFRRSASHVRGPRVHRVGPDQPGVHPPRAELRDAVHPDRVRELDRRGPRQEDSAAAIDRGAQHAGDAHPQALRYR